jgi:aerobic-type carbon monoxide dehydrogenase small subunit (CoxS/CutS family)
VKIGVTINGAAASVDARSDESLLIALRRLGLRSVRSSCEIGVCGACTVLLDGQATSSCLLLAPAAAGRTIVTAEGLAPGDPVASSFMLAPAFQCGYCTPGFLMTLKALLSENPHPGEAELVDAVGGNLCRCGTYTKILAAARQGA